MKDQKVSYFDIIKFGVFRKLSGKPVPDLLELNLSILTMPLLLLAVKHQLLEYIEEGVNSFERIAEKCHIGEREVRVVLCPLIALGIVDLKKDKLSLPLSTKTSLLKSGDYNAVGIMDMFINSTYNDIEAAIFHKKDTFSHEGETVTSQWEGDSVSLDFVKQYNVSHNRLTLFPAEIQLKTPEFKNTKKLLDVGGGLGTYAMEFVKNFPDRSAALFDLTNVCKVAEEHYKEIGFSDKISAIVGNFFVGDFPSGFDGMMFSNIFHDWSTEKNKVLIKKAYSSLPSGGKIFVNEALLNETKTGPLGIVLLDVFMFINHKSQQYTFNELKELLMEAGFINIRKRGNITPYSLVVGEKP